MISGLAACISEWIANAACPNQPSEPNLIARDLTIIQEPVLSPVNYNSLVINQNQVVRSDKREMQSEGIDPETLFVDGIANRNVAGDTFCEAAFGEDSKGHGETLLQVCALGVGVIERWGTGWYVRGESE